MDNTTVEVVVGLQLGTKVCEPHQCCHCNADVDSLCTHGLSCKWSDFIMLHLTVFFTMLCQQPSSETYRSDGKRPDGITMVR